MTPPIPLCEPSISGNEWAYVKKCLDTGWVSSVGSFVDRFECEIADYVGVTHAVATTSGTAALHLSLLATGVGKDDEVILPALSFVAPANAVRYVQAFPVFIDVDPDSWEMDPNCLLDFLNRGCERNSSGLRNRVTGRQVKAVLPVHILGLPVDLDPILELASDYGLSVVEDATESLGSEYKGRRVGCHGDVGCLSFNGNKLITSGGGGMILTDEDDLATRMRHLSRQAKIDGREYVHDEVGYNYRLTNLQAAMGVAQLEQIEEFLTSKANIARRYREAIGDNLKLRPQVEPSWAMSANWLFTVSVDIEHYGVTSRELMARLERCGIESRPLWKPLPDLIPFRSCHSAGHDNARRVYDIALSLPSSVGLSSEDQARVIEAIGY